jgi:nucleotide-binding universal stress UspA family protein
MKRILAAIDNSVAAGGVLATAATLAHLFGAEVDAVHVGEDGQRVASGAAAPAGLQLRTLHGPVVATLVGVADDDDVAAVVVGTRRLPVGGRPLGSTAVELITSLLKPVVVVPPDAEHPGTVRRVLVPLEGTVATSLAPKGLIELGRDADLEVVVLHVHDAGTLPAFTDQPQHDASAWREEFVARYCPWGVGNVSMAVRVGRGPEEILRAVGETGADLVAVGWAQELAAGRAPVVRELLERGRVPVLLLPVHVGGATHERRAPWNSSQSSPV